MPAGSELTPEAGPLVLSLGAPQAPLSTLCPEHTPSGPPTPHCTPPRRPSILSSLCHTSLVALADHEAPPLSWRGGPAIRRRTDDLGPLSHSLLAGNHEHEVSEHLGRHIVPEPTRHTDTGVVSMRTGPRPCGPVSAVCPPAVTRAVPFSRPRPCARLAATCPGSVPHVAVVEVNGTLDGTSVVTVSPRWRRGNVEGAVDRGVSSSVRLSIL